MVGVSWVYFRRRDQLIALATEFGLDTEGTVADLRTRVAEFVSISTHAEQANQCLVELEQQYRDASGSEHSDSKSRSRSVSSAPGDRVVPQVIPSPVHQAWEHQSPVCGPSYRHTDSLPTDPTWRPDLRGVEGILGRRDIVIRFFLSGLHPLAPSGRSELGSKIWRRKARGERRNGSRESLLVLLDQSWVRSQVIRADFRAGTSAYPLTLSPLCPVVPDDLQIFCKQTLAGLRRRPRLEKLRYRWRPSRDVWNKNSY
ncbi:hypothetical protein ACLKA7_004969 [Drosophila subpalustris]